MPARAGSSGNADECRQLRAVGGLEGDVPGLHGSAAREGGDRRQRIELEAHRPSRYIARAARATHVGRPLSEPAAEARRLVSPVSARSPLRACFRARVQRQWWPCLLRLRSGLRSCAGSPPGRPRLSRSASAAPPRRDRQSERPPLPPVAQPPGPLQPGTSRRTSQTTAATSAIRNSSNTRRWSGPPHQPS